MTWTDVFVAVLKQLVVLTFVYYYLAEVQHLWD